MKKVVVVTGASGGIGSKLVKLLLSEGYDVFSQYRSNLSDLQKTYYDHDINFDNRCFKVDMTDEAQVRTFRQDVELSVQDGTVWALINLAGASSNAMSWKMTTNDFKNVIDNNLLSTFLSCREFIPGMRTAGAGRIINASSIVALSGVPGAAGYCAAKAGIIGFTKAIALELAPRSVTANVLAFGYFDAGLINQIDEIGQANIKDRTPLRRFGKVEEAAHLVKFLLSEESAFMTGQTLHMNGGLYV